MVVAMSWHDAPDWEMTATVVSVSDGPDFEMVALADDQEGAGDYLILTRALEPEEQDIAHGGDRNHLEICDQAHSAYGGVTAAHLAPDLVALRLAPLEQFSGVSSVVVRLEMAVAERDNVLERLRRMLGRDGIPMEEA
jgi:hypothetical protein